MKRAIVLASTWWIFTALGTVGAAEPASPSSSLSETMQITTFYTTETGESRFRDLEIPFTTRREDGFGHALMLTAAHASPAVQFIELPAGLDQDWHNAPARQIVVVLRGTVEVETTDGERRRWHAGDAFLPADVAGKGHRTRCIDGPVRAMFVPLPADFDIATWTGK